MSIRGKLNNLWIFIKYLATEPFVQVKNVGLTLIRGIQTLNEIKSWLIIFSIFMGIFLLVQNRKMALIFALLLLITIFKYEWEKGDWSRKHLEKIKRKGKEEVYGRARKRESS